MAMMSTFSLKLNYKESKHKRKREREREREREAKKEMTPLNVETTNLVRIRCDIYPSDI